MNFSDTFKKAGLSIVYGYLEKDPDNNIPKIIDWVERIDDTGQMSRQVKAVKKALKDPDNNWRKWISSLYTDIDPEVRKATFTNLVIHSNVLSAKKRKDLSEKYDCNIPWAVLIDPTSACNLHCTGCWASEYGDKLNMSFDELDDIIDQGKALGIYMYIYTGGEPLVRKDDVIALCNKHSDCQFLAFTNGTLIDHAFADEMLRVKNLIPALSVEGFRSETDFRRGTGTYDRVEKAMEILKRKKLPFGISCCYTRANAELIGSEAYFDQMIEWGAKFCWFFTYMPVGIDAAPDLMATAEQRKYMYDQVRKF
ncbi:MAG TPA: radical SAM protein, partial [Anaerovoracaceae bacterium]|nr:radical SAM protein [Anaerovoracaceae bacterium]